MIKLHVGCGKRDFGKDWVHIDGGDYPHLKGHDVTLIDYPDNTADIIYASHLLEYFDRDEVIAVLSQWRRVLKPKGILRLSVPDFDKLIEVYLLKENILHILGPLYGKTDMSGKTVYHKIVFNYWLLQSVLIEAGFTDIRNWDWKTTDHSHIDDHSRAHYPHDQDAIESGKFSDDQIIISLNVEAIK